MREKNLVEISFLDHSFIQQINKEDGEKQAERLREVCRSLGQIAEIPHVA